MTRASSCLLAFGASIFLLGALLPACSSEGEPTPEPTDTPTPTPAATPTPTAPPSLEALFRTDSFAVAPEGDGFDLNSDGTKDNNIYSVFDTINTSLNSAVMDTCKQVTGYQEGDPWEGSKAEACTNATMGALEQAGLVLDVEDINNTLNSAIQAGTLIYLERLSGTGQDATLDWFNGTKNKDGAYLVDYALGSQTGTVLEGVGQVGPGTFEYELSTKLALDVIETYASFNYQSDAVTLTEGLLGGAVLESSVENLLRTAIPSTTEQQQEIEDQVVAAVLTAIDPLMDITINGAPAFSVAFTFSTVGQSFSGY